MFPRFLLSLGLVMSLQAQDPPDPLHQVRLKVSDTLDRLPRYMCTQTISRTVYEPNPDAKGNHCDKPPNTHIALWDRLRLDVAMTADGEMYSWAGARKFSDNGLIDLVHDGAISNGSFGNLLSAIFRSDSASFTPHGPHGPHGARLVEYGFQVPYEKSGYVHRDRDHRFLTGYSGTFLVDTQTGDLAQLTIRTDRLPPDSGSCYSTSTLAYTRVRLKDDAFLLPTESRLTIFSLDGSKSENRTVYSRCHAFVGETSLKFDEPPDTAPPDPRTKSLVIPPGIPFSIVLTEEINLQNAATGDIILAKLTTPIEDSTGVLVPAGALVTVRLVRLREFYDRATVVSLAYQIRTLEIDGVVVDLVAVPDSGKSFPQDPKKKPKELQPSVALGPLSAVENRAVTYNLRFGTTPYRIPVALRSNWVTANP